ncbi:hypothetical protein M9458_027515, partial [Cirrhinus mrigala]
ACDLCGRLHLPARLDKHHSAAVSRGPSASQLLQRHRLHELSRKTCTWPHR